ncbi:MAG: TlpA disulfide reductase family protein [Dehalococcoidales bacterium]|nr:TlpA disulfide reductase family protein [Dehalococcoidales bacterium]
MDKIIRLLPIIMLVTILASGCKAPAPAAPPATTNQSTNVPEGINIGNRAIDFELQTLDGKTVKLSDLRGKPVLLNFWATWCGPCRFEMPFLQQINDSWSAKGLVLLAVDIAESPATVEKFMTELNLSLTVPMDTDKKVAKAYGITAIPTTYFIDKNGIIQQKMVGAFPNKATIETMLKKIIP